MCESRIDVLTVRSVVPSNVHINIQMLAFPSYVDGDLDESIKRSASDRLGDLVPQVRARTSPEVFHDMALPGLCLELSFNVLYCRTQANPPRMSVNTKMEHRTLA